MGIVRHAIIAVIGVWVLSVAAPAGAVVPTVTVADYAFSPTTLTVAQGSGVVWHNNGPHTHTSTGNMPLSLWATGNITIGSTTPSVAFDAAGTYPYHCSIHTSMHGKIRVPITTSTSTGTVGDVIHVDVAANTASGFSYTVQKRADGGAWTAWKTGVTTTSVTFKAKVTGTFDFRSRLVRTSNGAPSGWSPKATVTIS